MEPCWFEDFCRIKPDSCAKCQLEGVHYVVSKAHIRRTGIPYSYWYTKMSLLRIPASAEKALEYYSNVYDYANRGLGMYLYNTVPGTGKTTIACACLLRYLAHFVISHPCELDSCPIYYINVSEYMEELRANMNRSQDDPRRLELEGLQEMLFDPNRAPKLMVFDDIGAERPSEWVRERLYNLINFRVSNGLASIYTSNCGLPMIGETLGPRIESRIRGSAKPILVGGVDRREQDW